MKSNLGVSGVLLALLIVLLGLQPAAASNIPILTWEQGKLQSVVLGGGEDRSSWEVVLVSSTGSTTSLKASSRNEENFVVFSAVIPRDTPIGTYTLLARGLSDESVKVAVVNVVKSKSYEIGRVPGDFIYIFILFIGAISILVSLSRRRLSLNYLSSITPRERFINGEPAEGFIQKVHNLGRLESLRISVQQNISEGVFGSLVKANSAILHFRSTNLWSILPLLLAGLGVLLAADISIKFGYLFLLFCLLGNLDIFSGIVGAIAFSAVSIFNTQAFSFGSILGIVFLSSLAFAPNLLVQVLGILTGNSEKKYDWAKFALVALVIHFLALLQRSLLSESYLSTSDELLVLASVLVAITLCEFLRVKREKAIEMNSPLEEVRLEIEILPSRSSLIILALAVFSVTYVWSLNGGLASLVALLAVFPILLSIIDLERLKNFQFFTLPRKPVVEILVVCITTYLVFVGLTSLPLVTYSLLDALLFSGFVPVILHAFYVAVANNAHAKSVSVSA